MNEVEWTNKQKISKRGSKTLAISNKDTTSQKTCNFCKEPKCTVYISMFQIVNNLCLHQFPILSITYLIVRTFSLILGRLITNARIFTLFLCSYISPSNIPYFFRESSLLVGIKGISCHSVYVFLFVLLSIFYVDVERWS